MANRNFFKELADDLDLVVIGDFSEFDGWDAPDAPVLDEVDELLREVETAEQTLCTALWVEPVGFYEHFEQLDRAIQLEEHEGIFS